jgi:hypothetical protein
MSNREQLFELYKRYGLDKASETQNTAVFTYSNGYFNNAEIVSFGECKENKNKLLNEYRLLGFATRIVEFNSIEEMHKHLFNGFFTVVASNKRLQQEYSGFCLLQSEKLFNPNSSNTVKAQYEYVEPIYVWGNQLTKRNLIDKVQNQLLSEGPQLVILEAAAGFGKTCASYELINRISEEGKQIAPIFMELSKNRKATLFRYVLLDEIDKKFTTLSSELVLYEIKNGNVPLIIDGFDELISRSNKLIDSSGQIENDDVQTMLDTIAELYDDKSNAKVILTSRKSSIFTGESFKMWQEDKLQKCNITRVAIEEPTVIDWIGYEKSEALKSRNIPLASITNPILLAFLKNMTVEDFNEQCNDIENVINYYFNSLLERERERQSLRLKVEEQYDIMTKLAKEMLEFDISSEESSFIKDLLVEINKNSYKEFKERYFLVEERPTEEEFAAKLAGHALLNRISPNKNEVGFINDFVFGILITNNIINSKIKINEISSRHIDIACTSTSVRSIDVRSKLYNFISLYSNQFNYEELLNIDLKLKKDIMRNYENHYFANISFGADIEFVNEYHFSNCSFNNCTFNGCKINTSTFHECGFYECYFYNLEIKNNTKENCRLIFAGCHGYELFSKLASIEVSEESDKNYEKIILEIFWNKGRYSKIKVHQQNILKKVNADERDKILDTLTSLRRDGILFKDGQYWVLNSERIKDIRGKLGK